MDEGGGGARGKEGRGGRRGEGEGGVRGKEEDRGGRRRTKSHQMV